MKPSPKNSRNQKRLRRKGSICGLCLVGVAVSLASPFGHTAFGISGTAIEAAYTPRESVTANPVFNLYTSGASTSAASYVSSTTSGPANSDSASQASAGGASARHVSSDDEGRGTTKKHLRKRKAIEETGATRTASNGTTYEAKDAKEGKPAPLIAAPAKPVISLSTGFESRYIYHGVDIVGFNSNLPPSQIPTVGGSTTQQDVMTFNKLLNDQPKSNLTSPIVYANGSIEFKGFHFTVGYVSATDHTTPTRVEVANQAVTFNRYYDTLQSPYFLANPSLPSGPNHDFKFPTGHYNNTSELYQEIDINLDYTVGIIANVLDATVGYNSYIIPDHEFKGTNYQGEAFGRLTYKQIPYIQPSITYFRYISDARGYAFVEQYQNKQFDTSKNPPDPALGKGFVTRETGEYLNGNYVEARIDGAIPLFKSGNIGASFTPYVLVSVNDGYLTKETDGNASTEFNTFETGFKLPVTINNRFTVTPYLNYGYDISNSHAANDFRGNLSPFKEDVWGGVTFSVRF